MGGGTSPMGVADAVGVGTRLAESGVAGSLDWMGPRHSLGNVGVQDAALGWRGGGREWVGRDAQSKNGWADQGGQGWVGGPC